MAWITAAPLSVAFDEVVRVIGNGCQNWVSAVKIALFHQLLLLIHYRGELHLSARFRLRNMIQIDQVPLHALMPIYPLLLAGIITHIVR